MAVSLPQFFGNMGSEGSQKDDKGFHGLFVDSSGLFRQVNQFVVVFHKSGNDRIQAEAFQTLGDIEYQFVTQFHHFFGFRRTGILAVHSQFPETVQETVYAVDTAVVPLRIQFRRSHEKLVHTQRITAVIPHQIIGRYHIPFGLAHLDPVLSGDHALVKQLGKGLFEIHHADIIQEFRIKPGIKQMKHRMLHAADIHIHRQVLMGFFFGHQFFVVLVIHVTKEIPGRACPLGHGVGLPFCIRAADGAFTVHPFLDGSQRGFARSGWFIGLHIRKAQRKFLLRHRHIAAFRTVDDGDRLAPVTLSGEDPVSQLEVYRSFSDASLFYHVRRFFFQHGGFHAVPLSGIDHGAGSLRVRLGHIFNFFSVFGDDLDDRDIEFLRKLKVAVVMSRYAHDGSRTVIGQHVVGQPDRRLCAIQRIDGIASGEYAGFFLVLQTVHIGFHGGLIDITIHRLFRLRRGQRSRQRMFRSQNHEGCAIKGIRSGGINGDLLLSSIHREIHFRAVRLADPVGLHLLYLLRPVQFVQIIQQTVCIFGDLQHPLTQIFLGYLGAAALTFSVDHFFVGQSGFTGRTPVNGELLFIGQSLFKHFDKNPLGPFIEIRICGVHFHIPVIDSRDIIDLLFDIGHVLCRRFGRMNAHLDGIVFRRETESIPSHGMNQVIALQHFIAAPYI